MIQLQQSGLEKAIRGHSSFHEALSGWGDSAPVPETQGHSTCDHLRCAAGRRREHWTWCQEPGANSASSTNQLAYRLSPFGCKTEAATPSLPPGGTFPLLHLCLLRLWIWSLIWVFPLCCQTSFLYVRTYFLVNDNFEWILMHPQVNFCSTLHMISLRHLKFLSCTSGTHEYVLFSLLDFYWEQELVM